MAKQDHKLKHYPAADGHTLTVWGEDTSDPTKGVGANLHFGDPATTEEAWLATKVELSCSKGPDGELQRWASVDDGTARGSRLTISLDPDGKSFVSLDINQDGETFEDGGPTYLRIPFDDLLHFARQQVYGPDPAVRVVYDGPGGVKLSAFKGKSPGGRDMVGAMLSLDDPKVEGKTRPALALNAFDMGDGTTATGFCFHGAGAAPGPVTFVMDEGGAYHFSVDVSPDRSGDFRELTVDRVVEMTRDAIDPIKPTIGIMRRRPFFPPGVFPNGE